MSQSDGRTVGWSDGRTFGRPDGRTELYGIYLVVALIRNTYQFSVTSNYTFTKSPLCQEQNHPSVSKPPKLLAPQFMSASLGIQKALPSCEKLSCSEGSPVSNAVRSAIGRLWEAFLWATGR